MCQYRSRDSTYRVRSGREPTRRVMRPGERVGAGELSLRILERVGQYRSR